MKLEPTSLNIPLRSSQWNWRSQRGILLGTALLALLVTWPTSWLAAVTTLLIGVPILCALLYLIQFVLRRLHPLLQFVVLFGVYVPATWALSVAVQWFTAFIAGSAAA